MTHPDPEPALSRIWRRTAFEDGWAGAEQGLQLVDGADFLAQRIPGGYWSYNVFGHGLYHAMMRSRPRLEPPA